MQNRTYIQTLGMVATLALSLGFVYVLLKLLALVVALLSLGAVWVAVLVVERAVKFFMGMQLSLLEIARRKEELYDLQVDREIRIAQAQRVTFPSNHVAALHTADQLNIQYIPQRAQSVAETQCDPPVLLSPVTPDAAQLLAQTPVGQICLGVDSDGQTVCRTWKQLMGILVLGLMGGGKSNTAAWILAQELKQGSRVALIDKHARADESLHTRLAPFHSSYELPVGDNPIGAMRVINQVRGVLTHRMQGGTISYRLLLVVDEFTAIMRASTDKHSEWHEVAISLQGLIEDLGYEGRKYGVHVVCIGQASNASRTGGTEVRDLFHTRLVHGMRARQAQMLGLTEEKHDIQRLETGQICVDIEGRDNPFFIKVPEVTSSFLRSVAVQAQFNSTPLSAPGAHVTQLENSKELEERVRALHARGIGKAAIILELWGVKKGGSEKYRQAEKEYHAILPRASEQETACQEVSGVGHTGDQTSPL